MNRYAVTKLAILGVVGLALELTILETFSIRGARAEALLALACFASLFARDSRQGLLAAWIIGLVKDAGSAGPLGIHALLFLGAGWVVLQVRQILYREHPLTQLAVGFLAAFWVNALSGLFASATAGGIPIGILLGKTVLSALLTAALAPCLMFVLARTKWLVR